VNEWKAGQKKMEEQERQEWRCFQAANGWIERNVTLRTDGEIVQSQELFEEAQASDLLLVRDC
jgi:hypothetical protein